ncbi:MAG: hypothetical protein PHI67_07140 [Candidatus Methanomethylophilaceae archaeon]|nr:hypothetical protein [Candidatus Methanomethylophilaceae archaeon]
MELTLEKITELREKGLSWREIGMFFASEGEEPYLVGERARSMYRKQGAPTRRLTRSNKDGSATSEVTETHRDPREFDNDALLRYHGYDPSYWRVIESTCTKRGDNWTSRIKVASREVPQLQADMLATVMAGTLAKLDKVTAGHRHRSERVGMCAVVALYDVHYGRRSLTGDKRDVAEDVMRVVEEIVDKLVDKGVDKVFVTIGQDFLNSDNPQGATTKGTPQDNSMAWHEMLAGGLTLMSRVVEALGSVADVEVIYSEGNHDMVLSYAIAKALEERYRNTDRFEVDTDPSPRKYRLWGKTAIGFSHGDKEADLATVMQMENAPLWGASSFRYWFLGHLHQLNLIEKNGVTMIRCRAMALPDEWTSHKGFVGTERGVTCGIIGEDTGLEEIWLMRP